MHGNRLLSRGVDRRRKPIQLLVGMDGSKKCQRDLAENIIWFKPHKKCGGSNASGPPHQCFFQSFPQPKQAAVPASPPTHNTEGESRAMLRSSSIPLERKGTSLGLVLTRKKPTAPCSVKRPDGLKQPGCNARERAIRGSSKNGPCNGPTQCQGASEHRACDSSSKNGLKHEV